MNISNILETSQENDYLLVIISLIFCIITSFILMFIYKHKSNSLSSKIQISPIIPLLSVITFLVILIVKSSLALSLGLVGALSVIRFRTPVKEPEDLAFLFFAIAIGIGYGATQIYLTSIVFFAIIFIIWFFLSKKNENIKNDFNFIIESQKKNKDIIFDEVQKLLKKNSIESVFVKLEQDKDKFILYFRVSFISFNSINKIVQELNQKFKDIEFSIYENKVID